MTLTQFFESCRGVARDNDVQGMYADHQLRYGFESAWRYVMGILRAHSIRVLSGKIAFYLPAYGTKINVGVHSKIDNIEGVEELEILAKSKVTQINQDEEGTLVQVHETGDMVEEGLVDGGEVVLFGFDPSYGLNGAYTATVLDDQTLRIPGFYTKGIILPLLVDDNESGQISPGVGGFPASVAYCSPLSSQVQYVQGGIEFLSLDHRDPQWKFENGMLEIAKSENPRLINVIAGYTSEPPTDLASEIPSSMIETLQWATLGNATLTLDRNVAADFFNKAWGPNPAAVVQGALRDLLASQMKSVQASTPLEIDYMQSARMPYIL
jgi:hypothetical protein